MSKMGATDSADTSNKLRERLGKLLQILPFRRTAVVKFQKAYRQNI